MTDPTRRKPDKPSPVNRTPSADPYSVNKVAGGVLAVLILARLWERRFPGGWVDTRQFGDYSYVLPKVGPHAPIRLETLRREVRKGIGDLRSLLPPNAIARMPLKGSHSRERATRLVSAPSPRLVAWFRQHGAGTLRPGQYKAFARDASRILVTSDHLVAAFEESLGLMLINMGLAGEAASYVRPLRLAAVDAPRRASLTLLLARALVAQGSDAGIAEAVELLQPLKAGGPIAPTAEAELLYARTLCAYVEASSKNGTTLPSLDEVEEWHALLDQAHALLGAEAHADHATLGFLRHKVLLMHRDVSHSPASRSQGRREVDIAFLEAFLSWHSAQCPVPRVSEKMRVFSMGPLAFFLTTHAKSPELHSRLWAALRVFARAASEVIGPISGPFFHGPKRRRRSLQEE